MTTIWRCLVLFLTPQGLWAGTDDVVTWQDVQPFFQKQCVNCHGAHGAAKGLRLDSYDAVLSGSERGVVVISGDVNGSELIRRLRGESLPRMPFLGPKMSSEDVDFVERWIGGGLLLVEIAQ